MRYTKSLFLIALITFTFTVCIARSKKDKNPPSSNVVDSGSFGVFVNGNRVATETFNVQQNAEGSNTTSELKVADGSRPPVSSAWQLTSTGDLRHYEWNDGKDKTTVEPGDQLLHQQIVLGSNPKPIMRQYILPASTPILDDYTFVQREVLTWRFLASGCQQDAQGLNCKAPSQYGVLVPHQQVSLAITIEFKGMENVTLKGQQKQMGRFDLKAQNMEWQMWMDGIKLMRILIPSDNTEIVRD